MRIWRIVSRCRLEAAAWLEVYFFYAALLAVMLGIIMAVATDRLWGFAAAWLPALAGLGTVLLLLAVGLKRSGLILPLLLLLGFGWGGLSSLSLASFAVPAGEAVVFEGRVIEVFSNEAGYFDYLAPAVGNRVPSFIIQGKDQNNWRGRLLVTGAEVQVKPGDRLQMVGVVRPQAINYNFGVRDSGYLPGRGISAVVRAVPGSLRFQRLAPACSLTSLGVRLREQLFEYMGALPPLQQALLKGIGFGRTELLGSGQNSVLQQTGIMHIFAVSGLHIGYVLMMAGWFTGLFRFYSVPVVIRRILKFLAILFPMLLFDAAVGFSPSVLRATIMGLAVVICELLGAAKHSGYALVIAGFVLLLWEPQWALQPGFLLSFAAAGGIVFTSGLWRRLVGNRLLAAACSAQFMILPLVAYFFNTISFVGLLLSPFAALAAGPVVILLLIGVLLLPFGLTGIPLAGAGLLAELVYRVAELCAGLPGAFAYTAAPGAAVILAYYGLVGLGLYFMARLGNVEEAA